MLDERWAKVAALKEVPPLSVFTFSSLSGIPVRFEGYDVAWVSDFLLAPKLPWDSDPLRLEQLNKKTRLDGNWVHQEANSRASVQAFLLFLACWTSSLVKKVWPKG